MAETQLIPNPVAAPPGINISELSRQSGLSRTTVRQRLKDGWKPEDLIPVESIEIPQYLHDVSTSSTPRLQGAGRHWILGLASGALGLALAGVGLVINARYAASLGSTAEDGWLLATLGLAIDLAAVIGLSVTALLWQSGRFLSSLAAFMLWIGFAMMSVIAIAAFTATSFGDFAAGRASVIETAIDLRQQRVDKIEAARTAVASAITARDQECGRVGDNCRARVRELNQRQADLAAALAVPTVAGPSVSVADPGAHMLAAMLGVDQASIQKLRIAGLTVAPITAGLFLAFATMLLGASARTRHG
jgi:hypothetical protein